MSGTRYGVILAAMRTGSNLLETCLARAPGIKAFGEAFNPAFVGAPGQSSIAEWFRERRDADPLGALQALRAEAAAKGQVGVFRLFPDHDAVIHRHVLSDPDAIPIRLSRDHADSFVSLLIARETGQWILRQGEERRFAPVEVDLAAYRRFCADRTAADAEIDERLSENGRQPIEISYDDLAMSEALATVFEALGVTSPRVAAPPILRQNPEPLWHKIRNYAALAEALGRPVPELEAPDEPRMAIAGRLGIVTTGCVLPATAVLLLELLRANAEGTRPQPIAHATKTLQTVPVSHPDVDTVVFVRQSAKARADRLFERDVLGRSGSAAEDVRHVVARRGAPLADALTGDPSAIETCRAIHATLFTTEESGAALTDYASFDQLADAVRNRSRAPVAIIDEPDLIAFAERLLRPGQVARLHRNQARRADPVSA